MSKKIVNKAKKSVAGFLAFVMVISGIVMIPEKVEAAAENAATVTYEDRTDEFNSMWKENGAGTAPTKPGYIFGGWYKENGTDSEGNTKYAALTEDDAKIFTGTAFAKFVPSYVLSVKAQINSDVTEGDKTNASIRLISSVDSKNYQKVGFEVLLNNKYKHLQEDDSALETTKVYSGGLQVGDDEKNVRTPQNLFGKASNYISVWRLDNILDKNDDKIIYVRPYWVTRDGTTVKGLAKYIRVEDGYKGYVSIPVNLHTAEEVAAGILEMSYDSDILAIATDTNGNPLIDCGHVFDELEYNMNLTNAIRFVANTSGITDASADDIYVNVRFTIKDTEKYAGAGKGTFLTFAVGDENFCNAEENPQKTVDAWDIQY